MTNAKWQKYHGTIIYKLRLKSFFKLHGTEEINDGLQSLVIIPYPLPLPPGKMQDIKTGPSKEKLHSAFSWPQKLSLIKHQSAGQEDILGQETYSSVYKIAWSQKSQHLHL